MLFFKKRSIILSAKTQKWIFGVYMNDFMQNERQNDFLCGLRILSAITEDEVVVSLADYRQNECAKTQNAFLRAVYKAGAECDLLGYISRVIIADDNPFSRACSTCKNPSEFLLDGLKNDLFLINKLISGLKCVGFSLGTLKAPLASLDEDAVLALKKYYFKNGYGTYLENTAFRYTDGELVPILTPSAVTLADLKGFTREQAEVRDNFENFVLGLPYADMLLYGDRGTGKSSTVHAMVNEFSAKKLRLVELNKEQLLSLPRLKTKLAEVPLKFIVFIDDFSLSESDERFSTLKASLQGTMEGCADNVMIVATSNRRHIVEENFDTRHNSVHAGDSEQELLSLADRFGITVLFSGVGKAEYLFIVNELAKDEKIVLERDRLEALAERWALQKGGRSPRRAKQFIGFVSACEKKGKKVDF